jgi:hypothetical protein
MNASSGSDRTDYCGTFYGSPFSRDTPSNKPLTLNGGFLDQFGTFTTGNNSSRLGFVSSSLSIQDWRFKFLSLTGTAFSGTEYIAQISSIQNPALPNEASYNSTISPRMQSNGFAGISRSGSAFAGKILDKIYLAFYYDSQVSYFPLTSAYIEIDSLQILRHLDGDGIEPPQNRPYVSASIVGASATPDVFGSSLTYWASATGSLLTLTGTAGRIQRLGKFSGGTTNFFDSSGLTGTFPITSSLTFNAQTYPTVFFSGNTVRMSSSNNDRAFISGSGFRNFYVLNIVTSSANSAIRYSNHTIRGDTSGQWGIYHRNNGNGSGSIDCLTVTSPAFTASVNFKFGTPIMIEHWRDLFRIYLRVNNATVISSSVMPNHNLTTTAGANLGYTSFSATEWHLLEMVESNSNNATDPNGLGMGDINALGVANYLAAKYGFPTRDEIAVTSGELW